MISMRLSDYRKETNRKEGKGVDQMSFRIFFKDEITYSNMYRTFDTLSDALDAMKEHEARNTPEQYKYYTAQFV